MRIPYEWLREFLPVPDSPEAVAHKLTMIGLEVESLERTGDDVIFEVNVTPNRADCLSVIGVARDLSALYGMPVTLPDLDFLAETGELDFNIDIIDPDLCHRYAGRIVKNITIGPSPQWLKKRVEQCGIRSINNVVDVTNYVLLELGHPLHAFDLNTVRGHLIRVGTPKSVLGAEKMTLSTLDGVERTIPGDGLLIWDAERPIAIAGIMGGLDTEVKSSTRDLFIESAYFSPRSIRRTSKALGLKTESSYRFERGTDIKMLKKSLDRAAMLLKKVAGGSICGKLDIYPKRHIPEEITVRYDRINATLGLSLSREEILSCLKGLGFEIAESSHALRVKPPAYRSDVSEEWDVTEEVARIYGYEKIPAELPKIAIGGGQEPNGARRQGETVTAQVRQALLTLGFTEVINFSFMGGHDLDLLSLAADDRRRNVVEIQNPLRSEDSHMRTTLLPGLIRDVLHNVARGNRDMRLFEVGRVFMSRAPKELPLEKKCLGAISYKEKIKSLYREEVSDFYVMKGVLEGILLDLKIQDYSFGRSSEPFLHPGQSADIFVEGSRTGYLGVLSPALVDLLGIKAQKPSVVVLELDMEALLPYTMQVIRYSPLPKYPYVERDTAIVVDNALEVSALMNWLRSYRTDLVEEVSLFDVFRGGAIPEGRKSIAFSVRYRSSERTLTDEEVDALHSALVEFILDKTKGQVRT